MATAQGVPFATSVPTHIFILRPPYQYRNVMASAADPATSRWSPPVRDARQSDGPDTTEAAAQRHEGAEPSPAKRALPQIIPVGKAQQFTSPSPEPQGGKGSCVSDRFGAKTLGRGKNSATTLPRTIPDAKHGPEAMPTRMPEHFRAQQVGRPVFFRKNRGRPQPAPMVWIFHLIAGKTTPLLLLGIHP